MKINVILSMPRSGSSFLSQLIEADGTTALRLSPFFSYTFRKMSYELNDMNDIKMWCNALVLSDDPFVCQEVRRETGEYPSVQSETEKRVLYIKDTRNFFDYVRLFFISQEINFIFLSRALPTQLNSWLSSPEWKGLDYNANNILYANNRKNLEDNPTDEYWGIADYFYFDRLMNDFIKKFPKRCVQVHYEDLVVGRFDSLLKVDPDLDLEKLKGRFNVLGSGSAQGSTPYSVYRERGYTGKTLLPSELPDDLLSEILVDKYDKK